jgi:hypothetical protein
MKYEYTEALRNIWNAFSFVSVKIYWNYFH